jgi:hypothetical protein
MPTTTLRIAYRPIRIGFLVRAGVLDDVVDAARFNTLVWGGICNPIIALDEEGTAAERLVQAFKVDGLVALVANERLEAFIESHPHLKWPGDLFHTRLADFRGPAGELGVVDVRLLYGHYHDEVAKNPEKSPFVLPTWPDDHPFGALLAASFGEFSSNAPPQFKAGYLGALLAREEIIANDAPIELISRESPISFTGDSIERWARSSYFGDGVVVGDANDAQHLADFWNLRAAGFELAFWHSQGGGPFREWCQKHLANVWDFRPRPGEVDLGPHIWRCGGWEDGFDIPPELIDALPQQARPVKAALGVSSWTQPTTAPVIFTAREQSVLASVEERSSGRWDLVFARPPHPFEQSGFEPFHGHWMVTVRPLIEAAYSGSTLRLPFLPDLNEWFGREISHRPREVRVEPKRVALFSTPWTASVQISPVREERLIRRVFERAGIVATASHPGIVASQIVRVMGGPFGCQLFKIDGVRTLLSRPKTYLWEQAVEVVKGPGAEESQDAAEVLVDLTERAVLRVGLHIRCPACEVKSRHEPNSLGHEVACPRCGSVFRLASHVHRKSTRWEYQVSGFFEEAGQHGAIATILSLLRLGEDRSDAPRFTVTAHNLELGGVTCESDLLVLECGRGGVPAAAVAECKSFVDEIEEADIANLSGVANAMRASGVECYLVFATTRDHFKAAERVRFDDYTQSIAGEWALDGDPFQRMARPAPILLTIRELGLNSLEFYAEQPGIPHPYPRTLRDLAENSAAIYLSPDNDGGALSEDTAPAHTPRDAGSS